VFWELQTVRWKQSFNSTLILYRVSYAWAKGIPKNWVKFPAANPRKVPYGKETVKASAAVKSRQRMTSSKRRERSMENDIL
jgi:hypothetical protein